MKIKIILLAAFLLANFCVVFAQADNNYGLVLRGRDYEGERIDGKDNVVWKAKLAMEFINNGKESVILICPNKEFSPWQSHLKFWDVSYFGEFTFSKDIKREKKSAEELQISAEFLNSEEPPPNLTIIIKPGETYPFEDYLEVKQKFSKDEKEMGWITWEGLFSRKETKSKYQGDYSESVGRLQYLKIKYEISLLKYQTSPDQLEILNARWRKFGIIPIDPNGGFSITSDMIRNDTSYKRIKNGD